MVDVTIQIDILEMISTFGRHVSKHIIVQQDDVPPSDDSRHPLGFRIAILF